MVGVACPGDVCGDVCTGGDGACAAAFAAVRPASLEPPDTASLSTDLKTPVPLGPMGIKFDMSVPNA